MRSDREGSGGWEKLRWLERRVSRLMQGGDGRTPRQWPVADLINLAKAYTRAGLPTEAKLILAYRDARSAVRGLLAKRDRAIAAEARAAWRESESEG